MTRTDTEPVAPARRTDAARRVWRKYRFEILLLTPLLLYAGVFVGYFVVQNFIISFEAPPAGGNFPTFDSYREVFAGFRFWEALTNTAIIAGVSVSFELLIGLGFAVLAAKRFVGSTLFRAILILPLGIPGVVAATNMRYIFASSGYANKAVRDFTGLFTDDPIQGFSWLLDPLAVMTVAFSDMWKVTPLVFLILLAGLQAIPSDYYEASAIDGASAWQTFTNITLPLLRPAILTAAVVRGIDALRIFVQPLALGVSGQVPVLSSEVYDEYLRASPTTAAVNSVMLSVMIGITVYAMVRVTKADIGTLA